jgi:hypothetical protein
MLVFRSTDSQFGKNKRGQRNDAPPPSTRTLDAIEQIQAVLLISEIIFSLIFLTWKGTCPRQVIHLDLIPTTTDRRAKTAAPHIESET